MTTLRKVTCKKCGEVANWADEYGPAFSPALCACAKAGVPALQWTSTPPSEPGWYWIEDEEDPSEVFPMADREDLFVCRQDERGDKVFCVVAEVQMKWCGPLRRPPIPLPDIAEEST